MYVDDIIITGNNDAFTAAFVCRFSLKDLGPLHHFLAVKVIPTTNGLFLSQSQYVVDILEQFDMTGAKAVSIPMCTSVDLCAGERPLTQQHIIVSLVACNTWRLPGRMSRLRSIAWHSLWRPLLLVTGEL